MGSILAAECQCGYKVETLFAGGGFTNFQTVCDAPAVCKTCEKIITLNYIKTGTHLCPDCKNETLFYDNPSLKGESLGEYPVFDWYMGDERTFILLDSTYYCPKCKRMHLRFNDIGNWD